MGNDALGLVFQIVENRFCCKAYELNKNNNCPLCLLCFPFIRFDLQCSKSNTNTDVDCMCLYLFAAVVVCVCVLCCVRNSIKKHNVSLLSDPPFPFWFFEIHFATNKFKTPVGYC
jgi:hypothetical protein